MRTVHDTVDIYNRTRKVPRITAEVDDKGRPIVEVGEVVRTFCTTLFRTRLTRSQVAAIQRQVRVRKGKGGGRR